MDFQPARRRNCKWANTRLRPGSIRRRLWESADGVDRRPAAKQPGRWSASGWTKIWRTKVPTRTGWSLGTQASRLRRKCTRHRCQLAVKTWLMRPSSSWASEMINWTPPSLAGASGAGSPPRRLGASESLQPCREFPPPVLVDAAGDYRGDRHHPDRPCALSNRWRPAINKAIRPLQGRSRNDFTRLVDVPAQGGHFDLVMPVMLSA